ncbi:hypothetical protein ACVMAJ_000151 [Bradyrhizobium sp. USDA 4448]
MLESISLKFTELAAPPCTCPLKAHHFCWPVSKLTKHQQRQAIKLLEAGEPQSAVARLLDVDQSTISRLAAAKLSAAHDSNMQTVQTVKRGGRPKGTGLYGVPTFPVRVPVSLLAEVQALVRRRKFERPLYIVGKPTKPCD